jgi:hypothetical protein
MPVQIDINVPKFHLQLGGFWTNSRVGWRLSYWIVGGSSRAGAGIRAKTGYVTG